MLRRLIVDPDLSLRELAKRFVENGYRCVVVNGSDIGM